MLHSTEDNISVRTRLKQTISMNYLYYFLLYNSNSTIYFIKFYYKMFKLKAEGSIIVI